MTLAKHNLIGTQKHCWKQCSEVKWELRREGTRAIEKYDRTDPLGMEIQINFHPTA